MQASAKKIVSEIIFFIDPLCFNESLYRFGVLRFLSEILQMRSTGETDAILEALGAN
jgi:hypothetical protein